jgi:hypothetical protein
MRFCLSWIGIGWLAGCAAKLQSEVDVEVPRLEPLRPAVVEDALLYLPGVIGRMVSAGDVDRDGREDLFTEHGGSRSAPEAIVAIDAHGSVIRRLWSFGALETKQVAWDVGDADGDGAADLLVGLPEHDGAGEDSGRARLISGRTGETLRTHEGERAFDRLGTAVTILGDIDGDGGAEYALVEPVQHSKVWGV